MTLSQPPYQFALGLQGLVADLPSGASWPQETIFWATDTTTLYVNDGTTFHAVSGGSSGQGLDGLDGSPGPRGPAGQAGADGLDGSPGPPGLPGITSIAVLQLASQTETPTGGVDAYPLVASIVLPVDPVGLTYGTWKTSATAPPTIYTAQDVFAWSSFTVTQVDTTHDLYDLSAEVIVSNASQSQFLELTGSANAHAGTPNDTATIGIANLSVASSAGADLSYSTGTGKVTSAAGGTYAVEVVVSGFWD